MGAAPTISPVDLVHGRDDEDRDNVGVGIREIRIRESCGIYRVMYVAKFEEAVYVLHCFQKKTQVTSKHDKEIVETRYCIVLNARKVKK